MAIYKDVLETIGNTPVVKMNQITEESDGNIYAKLERFNPGGSVKDRIALNMILEAEREGKIKPGDVLVEPTSGNTGIGLAMVATVRGYRMILTMPDTMSFERRALLEFLGAEIILTPGELGMRGAIEVAQTLVKERGYYMAYQFSNPANPKAHEAYTAREILEDFSELNLDYFVAGVGTGGTLSGVGRVLKKHFQGIKNIAVEPLSSAVLAGREPGLHGIQGIGAGFIPENYDTRVVDQIIGVSDEDALKVSRQIAAKEGILVGISSGANMWAALKIAKEEGSNKNILVILPDGAEHYMMTALFKRGY
ncbi:cysteine synthase A [Deltaproteobacteria bacterium TL4]